MTFEKRLGFLSARGKSARVFYREPHRRSAAPCGSLLAVSRLAVGNDDHPEAARKHLDDARVLSEARRYDSAAYHAGYVVECSLKAVLLHDRSYDSTTAATDTAKLNLWAKTLSRKPFGHDLARLLAETVGPEGARYLPLLDAGASILDWTETMRYWASGVVGDAKAQAFLSWAELAAQAVIQMTLDGVV